VPDSHRLADAKTGRQEGMDQHRRLRRQAEPLGQEHLSVTRRQQRSSQSVIQSDMNALVVSE
jgi:hypothetical protein